MAVVRLQWRHQIWEGPSVRPSTRNPHYMFSHQFLAGVDRWMETRVDGLAIQLAFATPGDFFRRHPTHFQPSSTIARAADPCYARLLQPSHNVPDDMGAAPTK